MSWSNKYKKSIDCNNPKGFSQKAHCAGKKKRNENIMKLSDLKEEIKNMIRERSVNAISKAQQKNLDDISKALEFYKKNKHTDKKEPFIKLLKKLGKEKERLAKELDDKVSGMYKNAEYKGESVSENFTREQAYNGLFKFKHKGKKYVGKVVRSDGGKFVLSLHDIGLLSIPNVSPNDMEYLGNESDQGKKGLPYLSAHPKNFQKVKKGQFYKELEFKGGFKFPLPTHLSDSQLKDINKYYRLKLTKDDLKVESVVNEMAMGFDSMTGLFYLKGVPFTRERVKEVIQFFMKSRAKSAVNQFEYTPSLIVKDKVGRHEVSIDPKNLKTLVDFYKKNSAKLASDKDF